VTFQGKGTGVSGSPKTTTPPNPPAEGGGELLDRVCPRCKASAGEECVDRSGKACVTHVSRGRTSTPQDRTQQRRVWLAKNTPELPPAAALFLMQLEAEKPGGLTAAGLRARVHKAFPSLAPGGEKDAA
jgi:hypothetical protein